MASPKSEGRMIRKDISRSQRVAKLSAKALALFTMLIPHYNAHGKMDGNPHTIKGTVVPFINWFDISTITRCLHEISEKTNVKYFQVDRCWYLHSLNYDEHQALKRKGRDYLPSCSGVVPDKSGTTPGLVRPEVEVEVEVEREVDQKHYVAPSGATPPGSSRKQKPKTEFADLAVKIVGYYEGQIREHRPSRYRAREHIVSILKAGAVSAAVLWECVNQYEPEAARSEAQFRKVAGNFFGRDAVYKAYLDAATREVAREQEAKLRRSTEGSAGGAGEAEAAADVGGVGG
jgi:hypothetical protein